MCGGAGEAKIKVAACSLSDPCIGCSHRWEVALNSGSGACHLAMCKGQGPRRLLGNGGACLVQCTMLNSATGPRQLGLSVSHTPDCQGQRHRLGAVWSQGSETDEWWQGLSRDGLRWGREVWRRGIRASFQGPNRAWSGSRRVYPGGFPSRDVVPHFYARVPLFE